MGQLLVTFTLAGTLFYRVMGLWACGSGAYGLVRGQLATFTLAETLFCWLIRLRACGSGAYGLVRGLLATFTLAGSLYWLAGLEAFGLVLARLVTATAVWQC